MRYFYCAYKMKRLEDHSLAGKVFLFIKANRLFYCAFF